MKLSILLNRWLLVFVCIFSSLFSKAQDNTISGKVVNASNQSVIDYASVVLLDASDSSSHGFTFSEEDGNFSFDKVAPGNYLVQIFHTGFTIITKKVLVENASVDVGTVSLVQTSETLSTAFINATTIPVAIRGDTLVYNPNAFKTKNNATVEDLLKKLPGVQVSKDGKVTAQGEQVLKVLVNGKEFFGNDPTKATQNIDASSLEKVEILDKKSDDAEFSGVDDGNREKVINLVLKEDANKGYFGKLEAGGGTEDTYLLKGTLNYFKDENQITAIGNLNNLNQNGFDWREYYQMLNGQGGINLGDRTYWYNQNEWLGSTDKGRQENGVLGTNAHLKLTEKSSLDASYFFMNRKNTVTAITNAENYLPEDVIYSNSTYDASSVNGQHKGILKYTWKPDTLNWIEFGAELDASNGSDTAFTLSESMTSLESNGFLNTSMSKTQKSQFNQNLKARFIWRHKFKNNKNSMNIQLGTEMNNAGDTSLWVNRFSLNEAQFNRNLPFEYNDVIAGTGTILYGRAGYTFALDSFRNVSLMVDNKMTLGDFNMTRLDLLNDLIYQDQSPVINTNYRVSKAQVMYSKNDRKKSGWYTNFGLGVINIAVDRELQEAGDQRFQENYLMPSMNFYLSHHKPNKHRFGSWFSTNEQFPNTNQINPIRNIQSPIYTTQGDITLDPYVSYNWGANYNKQNRTKHRYFHLNYNQNFTPNALITSQVRDENNITSVTYLNKKPTIWSGLNAYYSFMIQKLNLEVGASLGANNYQFYSILNTQEYLNNRTNLSYGMDLTFELEDLEIFVEYEPTYTIQDAGFVSTNPRYWSHNFAAEVVYDITDKVQISSEYDVFYFEGQQVGQKQLIPLLNAEVQWNLDSMDRWTLGVIGYDIFNQNQNIDRNFFGNSFSETRQNSITRFFMFSVKYTIRKGKKKDQGHRRHWN